MRLRKEPIPKENRHENQPNKTIIGTPRIGFLNLMGHKAEQVLHEDKIAFGSLFTSSEESEQAPPICDVLLIYCFIDQDGYIRGTTDGLRDIIRRSGARIAIVASENSTESYIAAGKDTVYGRANLVMTLQRNGTAFSTFFRKLFILMMRGTPMPLAWVELAPQIPRQTHKNDPGLICSMEAGHIVFK